MLWIAVAGAVVLVLVTGYSAAVLGHRADARAEIEDRRARVRALMREIEADQNSKGKNGC